MFLRGMNGLAVVPKRFTRRQFSAGMGVAVGACAAPGPAAPARRTRLLVLILLEQFRPDYLDQAEKKLMAPGIGQLLAEGAYFPDARMAASTFSASGLSTLATGAWPAIHGIVADRWYDRTLRAPVSASGELLIGTTLAHEIVRPGNGRVYIAGMEESSVSLVGGRAPVQRYWMDESGRFSGRGQGAEWLAGFNLQHPIENQHGAEWMALGAAPEAPPLRTLVHDAARPEQFALLYKASPFALAAHFDFARELAARERLGQGATFDFLCLVEGSLARLGQETGARSPLIEQMVLHLDRQVGLLMRALDRAPGAGNYALVLAAAHGAVHEPAPASRPRVAINGELVAQALQRAGVRVQKYLYPFLYLDTAGAPDPERARIDAGRAALAIPGVAGYMTAGGHSSPGGEFERRFRNSFHPVRSGDVMLSYAPEYVEDFGAGRGISYGSLYNYDVRVPILFWGPPFRAGTYEDPVEAVDLAPTLARVSGVAPPSSSTGRVLAECFADVKLKR